MIDEIVIRPFNKKMAFKAFFGHLLEEVVKNSFSSILIERPRDAAKTIFAIFLHSKATKQFHSSFVEISTAILL